MTDPYDFFLRDTIAEAVENAFREVEAKPGFQVEFADRILSAIANRGTGWVVKKRDQWFEAATELGDAEASIPGGCWHFYRYSNATLAGDTEKNPDDTDYLHICTLDERIAELIALRELHRRWRSGEELPLCEHPYRTQDANGAGMCQACGHLFADVDG